MDTYEIRDAEERAIIEQSHREMFAILKEKEPGAIGFETLEIPEFQFKRTSRNYTHLKINGHRLLTCEDYTKEGGGYNLEAIAHVVARYLADERLKSFYKFMALYGPNNQ